MTAVLAGEQDATTHQDLMDLATRFAYDTRLVPGSVVDANGRVFVVVHQIADPVTGLNASAFRNAATGEVTVSFQGSVDLADWATNGLLLTSAVPPQFTAAEQYLAQVAADLGAPVTSVCGNSLGGGLAAYAAALHPGVLAVTVNPAPVPAAAAGLPAPDVHNYVSTADPLYRALTGMGMTDRLLGDVRTFSGTSFGFEFIAGNHAGSDLADDRPYDGSMAVPFSLFRPGTVLAPDALGAPVEVTVDALRTMAHVLRHQRGELLEVIATELVGVEDALEHYLLDLDHRDRELHVAVVEAVEAAYAPARWAVEELRDTARATLRAPLDRHPPLPDAVAWVWHQAKTVLVDAVDGMLGHVEWLGDLAAGAVADVAWQAARGLLVEESRLITRELVAQCAVLGEDLALVDGKWSAFAQDADAVAVTIAELDEVLAASIAAGTCAPDVVPASVAPWPAGAVQPLEEDLLKQFHQNLVEIRQVAAGQVVVAAGGVLVDELAEAVSRCDAVVGALQCVEDVVGQAARQVAAAVDGVLWGPGGWMASMAGIDDDLRAFRDWVEDLAVRYRTTSDLWQDDVGRLRGVLVRLPEVLEELRPYVEQSFFSDGMIEQAYDSFTKCRNLVERSRLAFAEVEHQLGEHRAAAVDALADRAGDLRRDLGTAGDNLSEMVG